MRGHVLFQAARLPARVGTGWTFKWFFAGVRHQMLLQIAAGGGRVVASVAAIRLFSGVCRDVLFQPARFATRVRTSRTLVRLLAYKDGCKDTCQDTRTGVKKTETITAYRERVG